MHLQGVAHIGRVFVFDGPPWRIRLVHNIRPFLTQAGVDFLRQQYVKLSPVGRTSQLS